MLWILLERIHAKSEIEKDFIIEDRKKNFKCFFKFLFLVGDTVVLVKFS